MEMILLKKQKKLQVPSIIASVMVIMTLLISVGYSAFNTKLNVKDIKAVVRVEKDVRVTNVTAQGNNSGVSNWEDYNVNNISASVTLPQSTSTVTYTVEITNIGTVEEGILNITNSSNDLEYEIKNYTLKSKICDNTTTTKCSKGAIKKFEIIIKRKTGANTSSTTYNFTLGFDFRGFHKIMYKNITSTGLPTQILDGDTLNVNIGTGYTSFNITQGGNALTSSQYTYKGGQLTIQNVTGDLVIDGIKPISLYATIQDGATLDTFINFKNQPSYSNGQGNYIFSPTKDNAYPVYYYRGSYLTKNNVLFANLCWRIVRTTIFGGQIKMIYSGKPDNGVCPTVPEYVDISFWELHYTSSSYATYENFLYGKHKANEEDSASYISTDIDNWYDENINKSVSGTNHKYSDYVEDTLWFQKVRDTETAMDDAQDSRIKNGKPIIDGYTVSGQTTLSGYFNCVSYNSCGGIIKNPIGLINVDEAMLAGIAYYDDGHFPYITASGLDMFLLTDVSSLTNNPKVDAICGNKFCTISLIDAYPFKPSICLKNSVKYVSGDGTLAKPYEIYYD